MTHSGQPRDVVILGSTGSIGTQALDIIRRNPGRFRVAALAAGGGNVDLLARQAAEFGAAAVAVATPAAAAQLQAALRHYFGRTGRGAPAAIPDVLAGPDAICEVAAWPCDVVLNGVTGAAGLQATLAVLDAGRTLALANKESLIIGGPLVTRAAKPGQIVPVDSEHSTIAQCLRAGWRAEVRRLVLTASGGPFRGWSRDRAGGRHAGAGPRPPHLEDGAAGHGELRHAGEQGPGGDRGAPAVRLRAGPDRRGGAPAVDRALDGGVRRRRDGDHGLPAGHAAADLAEPGLAGPGARRRARAGLVGRGGLDLRAAGRRGVPRGRAGPGGGRGRRHHACRVQRRERGLRGRLPGGKHRLHPDC